MVALPHLLKDGMHQLGSMGRNHLRLPFPLHRKLHEGILMTGPNDTGPT